MRFFAVVLLTAMISACASVPKTSAIPAYAPVKFDLHQIGQPIVHAEINNKQVYLVLDTGAGATVIDADAVDALGIKVEDDVVGGSTGVGGNGLKTQLSHGNRFSFAGTHSDNFSFYIMDLKHVIDSLSTPERRISGVIGADWLDRHGAVINYPTRTVTATR